MGVLRIGMISLMMFGMMLGCNHSGHAEEGSMAHHVLVTPSELAWQDGPPSLPPGAQVAVLEGDPAQPGLFTIRVKVPGNYRIPAHWHPADERVTVISGTFHMGMGDVLDPTNGTALPAGSFAMMPAQTHHFAWTDEETVIQLHGEGPWQINYLNPADDPRQAR